MQSRPTRRQLLAVGLGAGLTSLAGCLGGDASSDRAAAGEPDEPDGATGRTGTSAGTDANGPAPPTAETRLPLSHPPAKLRAAVVSGGPPKDGIPAIDDPQFVGPGDVDWLAGGDPVFGFVHDGVARTYPQSVLVWHEIVNDAVAGLPVSVTYCPLTGTALCFERGRTTLGVSGRLVNSNLVMYDRGTDSRWPQLLATAIDGPLAGRSLRERPVVWTTWRRWRRAHPETTVLSRETGYVRNYGSDPYGRYNPRGGYYERESTLFEPLERDGRLHPKAVVLGARTTDGAVAFRKRRLRSRGLLTRPVGDVPYLAAYDPSLDTGYVYRNPEGRSFEAVSPDASGRTVRDADGERYAPEALPLDRVVAFDAMWFAWVGFYPGTVLDG